jgi:hypothetical protein
MVDSLSLDQCCYCSFHVILMVWFLWMGVSGCVEYWNSHGIGNTLQTMCNSARFLVLMMLNSIHFFTVGLNYGYPLL